jgi:hypothetical protein
MGLRREGGVARVFQISDAAAHQLVGFVHRAVEQYIVIGHVKMAVIVDPFGLDPHHRRNKRRGKDGFQIGAFQHAGFRSSVRRMLPGTVADFAQPCKACRGP